MNVIRLVVCAMVFGASFCAFAGDKIPADQVLPKKYKNIPVADILYYEIKDVDTPPVAKKFVKPDYPFSERRGGGNGTATVSVIVDVDGRVVSASSKEATSPAFGEAAVDAVKQWKFKPATRLGKPVRCLVPNLVLSFGAR